MRFKLILLLVVLLYPLAKESANQAVYEAKNTKKIEQMNPVKKARKIPKYKQTFLNVLMPMIKYESYVNIKTSVVLAQAALESGWLRKYPKNTNNILGISYNGKVIECRTINHCISKHCYLLTCTKRYEPVRQAETWQEQCDQLQKCGYAEDPNYSKKLKSIIKTNKLWQYDN